LTKFSRATHENTRAQKNLFNSDPALLAVADHVGYLTIMLLLPVVLKASTEKPIDFWKIATSPVALATYDVTFVTSLLALINGVFGL